MIRVCVKELLAKQGRSLYWLAKETGLSYPGLHKIAAGKTSRIEFGVLDTLCTKLKCKPGDLLVHTPD